MNGLTIAVVGATGGIGSHLTRSLTAAGARVVAVGRNQGKLDTLATGGHIIPVVADATDPESLDAAFETGLHGLAPLSGVVNCVGSFLLKPAHITSTKDWSNTIAANLTSAFGTLRAGARRMKQGGSVVLIASAAARTGLPNHEAISAAKAGVIGLGLSAAATYARSGLRVNVVAPGLVRTPLSEQITSNPTAEQASVAMHPLGRLGEPRDVVSAILWLLDPANSWITGQVLGVDGGLGTVRSMVRL